MIERMAKKLVYRKEEMFLSSVMGDVMSTHPSWTILRLAKKLSVPNA